MDKYNTYLLVNEQKENDFYIFEEVLSNLNRMYIFITQTKPENGTYTKLKFMEGDIDSAEAFLIVKDDLLENIQRKGYKLVNDSKDFKTHVANHPWIRSVLNQTNEYFEISPQPSEVVEDFETPVLRKLRI
jgi:hypothetical protein